MKRFQAAEEEAKEQRELDKLAADLERQHIREKRASQRRKQHEARERKQMEEYEVVLFVSFSFLFIEMELLCSHLICFISIFWFPSRMFHYDCYYYQNYLTTYSI